MNMFKKSIALFIVIVMVLAAVPAVFAADGLPGNTVTVTLGLGSGYGIDGNITVSDPDGIISSVKFSGPSDYDGAVVSADGGYFAYYSKNDVSSAGNCTITAKVTLKNDASLAGKSASIYFNGTTSQSDNGSFKDVAASASANVTMIQPKPEVKINYDELKKQISIAESLNKGDYTAESWKAVEDALANAKDHLSSKDQKAVDKAAADLAAAIAALVKMDYSKLEEAIKNGNDYIGSDAIGELWKDLFDALANANDLLDSGDQEAVDAAVENILNIIEQLKKAIAEALDAACEDEGCEHEGHPFCNIKIHKLWPILFFISLIGNIVLVFVIFFKKKEERREAEEK